LLRRRNKLLRAGRLDQAAVLANKINNIITSASSHKFSKLQQASTKELWDSVKGNSYTHSSATSTHPLLCDIDAVNQFFAARSYTDNRVITSTPNSTPVSNADTTIYDYEIGSYLRNIRSTSLGPDLVRSWVYRLYSVELSAVVSSILSSYFSQGSVPNYSADFSTFRNF